VPILLCGFSSGQSVTHNGRVNKLRSGCRADRGGLARNVGDGRAEIDVVPAESDQKGKLGRIRTIVGVLSLGVHVVVEPLDGLARLILDVAKL